MGIIKHELKSGQQFNSWTILNEGNKKNGERTWICKCICGRNSSVKTSYLVHGYSKRCAYCNTHAKRPYDKDKLPIQLWKRIVSNAKKRKIKIDISAEDAYEVFIKQEKKCALSGRPIRFAENASDMGNANASLDRINSELGYLKTNIQWVDKDINKMKNTFDELYFLNLCKDIIKYKNHH
jgi:hypothetical protein